ncbi:hypothetical protein NQ318_018862 [Aromia moschata]|uniref:Ig-like domain-containing protein n=1 Tax=Aromia moschata TaxID=1265417 RepID=A0AAV8ZHH8_9CUCU|nr:hypothetical protein NQ318_018862 [Aromia moschata]
MALLRVEVFEALTDNIFRCLIAKMGGGGGPLHYSIGPLALSQRKILNFDNGIVALIYADGYGVPAIVTRHEYIPPFPMTLAKQSPIQAEALYSGRRTGLYTQQSSRQRLLSVLETYRAISDGFLCIFLAFLPTGLQRKVVRPLHYTVSCVFQSPTPPQYVFWYHNEHMINYDTARGGITVDTVPGPRTQSRLTIRNTNDADSGNYTCSASNTEPASIYVFVSEVRRKDGIVLSSVASSGDGRVDRCLRVIQSFSLAKEEFL